MMDPKKTIPAILVLAPALARAAAESGEHGEGSVADLLWAVINFTLFLLLLFWFAWPRLKRSLADRRKRIESHLVEADDAFREAERELTDMQTLKARQSEDARKLLDEVRHDARKHRENIVQAAKRTAERICEDARLVGEHEAARAAKELRADFAERVIERAAAALREEIGDPDHERFVERFLGQVENEVTEVGR